MTATVQDVQRRLIALGFDPGLADGIRGRKTIAAVKTFQMGSNLTADGIVGPKTLRALFGGVEKPAAESPDATPWLDVGQRKKGLHEKRDNAALKAFLKSDGKTLGDPASLPWCGDFVETCIALALPEEPLPNNPYGAINWLQFGKPVSPRKGAVLVFWRGSPASWTGHVGFYVSEDATHFHVLGGNQTDSITVSRIAKARLRKDGSRWPLTAIDIGAHVVIADGSKLSETTNEA